MRWYYFSPFYAPDGGHQGDDFKMYGFVLYSTQNANFGNWINENGGWLSSISGKDTMIRVFENPEKWGEYWHNVMEKEMGKEVFNEYLQKWKTFDSSQRDMAYEISDELNIENKAFPCLIFTETLNSKEYLPLLIIENEEDYTDYFNDVFDIVKQVIKDNPNDLKSLEKGFQTLDNKWIKPEKLKMRGKSLIRWSNNILEIEKPIIGIITEFIKIPLR